MKIKTIVVLAFTLIAPGVAMAQERVSITHQPLGCISSDCGRAAITATITPTAGLKAVRVYFKAGAEGADYFVEMIPGANGEYFAVLPGAAPDTSGVTYRIVALGQDGSVTSSSSYNVPTTKECQQAALSQEQTDYSMNTAIGLTDASQTGAPKGFSCAGLVKVIGTDDSMSVNSACEEIRLAKSDPCAAAVVSPTYGKDTFVVLAGAAAAVGGAIVYDNNKDQTRDPVSRARP